MEAVRENDPQEEVQPQNMDMNIPAIPMMDDLEQEWAKENEP